MFECRKEFQFLTYFNNNCFVITVLAMLVKVNYSIIHHYHHLIRTYKN